MITTQIDMISVTKTTTATLKKKITKTVCPRQKNEGDMPWNDDSIFMNYELVDPNEQNYNKEGRGFGNSKEKAKKNKKKRKTRKKVTTEKPSTYSRPRTTKAPDFLHSMKNNQQTKTKSSKNKSRPLKQQNYRNQQNETPKLKLKPSNHMSGPNKHPQIRNQQKKKTSNDEEPKVRRPQIKRPKMRTTKKPNFNQNQKQNDRVKQPLNHPKKPVQTQPIIMRPWFMIPPWEMPHPWNPNVNFSPIITWRVPN